jgi:hypothetical protein
MSEAASAERSRGKPGKSSRVENEPAGAASRIAELQVSAHLMTLETGLFCVFQTPGSPPPDPVTALPGVRITPAPGIAGRPEAVSVSTFREDGWLNGTAALVRVTDGAAQILVTVYQLRGMDAAPKLQVLRLSGEALAPDAAAAGAAAAPGPATKAPEPTGPAPDVMAHIQRSGDVGGKTGEWIGTKGSQLWVEGFGLAPLAGVPATELEYQAVLGRNWLSPWIESGKYCGSRGMALPVLGLKIRLKGAAAKAYDCTYSATFVDGSAVGPVNAGETCEAESLAALESFQIAIHPRDGKSAVPKHPATGKADHTAAARQPPAKPPLTKPALKTR